MECQGAHHGAENSTKTGLPPETITSKLLSESSRTGFAVVIVARASFIGDVAINPMTNRATDAMNNADTGDS